MADWRDMIDFPEDRIWLGVKRHDKMTQQYVGNPVY
jgi:hypothetical protein